jgi:hypothetical protein
MAFDASRLKFGDLIAAGGAVVLFISLFLDWYTADVEGFGSIPGGEGGIGSAWDALDIGSIFLLLVVLVVLAIVVLRALGNEPAGLPVPLSTIVLGLGALATLYVLFRLLVSPVDVPDVLEDAVDIGRGIGVFLALLSVLAIAAGGFLSARERGEAVPGVAGGTGAAGGPLGGGQPPAGGYGQPTAGQPGAGQPAAGPPAGGAPAGAAPAAGATAPGAAEPGAQAGGSPAPDWYEDPRGEARLRYWDGTQWTDQTAD